MSVKGMPGALRTHAINRQPVDNQSANKCRRNKNFLEFGGFGHQWLSEIETFSWLPEVNNQYLPLCDLAFSCL